MHMLKCHIFMLLLSFPFLAGTGCAASFFPYIFFFFLPVSSATASLKEAAQAKGVLLALLPRYTAHSLVLRAFLAGTEGSPHVFPSKVCTADTHHVPGCLTMAHDFCGLARRPGSSSLPTTGTLHAAFPFILDIALRLLLKNKNQTHTARCIQIANKKLMVASFSAPWRVKGH